MDTRIKAASDAAFPAQGPTLNGMPIFPMPSSLSWVSNAVCVHCRKPVASMEIVFCDDCRVWFEHLKQRGAK